MVVVCCPQCYLTTNSCRHLVFSFMLAKSADFRVSFICDTSMNHLFARLGLGYFT